ncbi:hypothetical protein D3C72_1529230 [compost metagenome]
MSLFVRDHFHETFSFHHAHCATVSSEWELADQEVVVAFSFRFSFSHTCRCNFWICEHNCWNCFRIVNAVSAGDHFCYQHTFVRSFVGKHRLTSDIADSKDVRNVCSALSIHFNKATLVNCDTPSFQVRLVSVWTTTYSY